MTPSKQNKFLELYQSAHKNLILFCRAITGNIEDAKDLAQDTILVAFENYEKLKNELYFKSWLLGIAINLNKMRLRKKKPLVEYSEKDIFILQHSNQNSEIEIDLQLIHKKILTLKPKTAEALILFHISDLTLEEIHKIQGGSLSGVKLRIKRGREKIIQMMNESPHSAKVISVFF